MSTLAKTQTLSPLPTLDEPFLPPIERPRSLMLRLVYSMSRRQFGKVMTPLKVFVARMPLAFGQFVGKIGRLDKKLILPRETVMLIREHVARINVCLFCIDIGRAFTIKSSMNQAKFDALERLRHQCPLHRRRPRRPRLCDRAHPRQKGRSGNLLPPRALYSERQICEIVWLVASEHVYNMTNIGLNIHSDMLCDIARKSA